MTKRWRRKMNQNQKTKILHFLKLSYLLENWDQVMEQAEASDKSYDQFLSDILKKEYQLRLEQVRLGRIKRSKVPNEYVIDTYPFDQQPHVNKKRLLQRFDSLDFLKNNRNLILMGPTGTGKTGLASSFLRQGINNGFSGRFVVFNELMEELLSSIADQSTKTIIRKYTNYQCLLIDDLCFIEAEKTEVGLFYTLIQKRYKKSCTIITTPLGLSEWNTVFKNKQMTDALISRLNDNGHIINFKKCKNIRKDPDID
jgi:DNA replication protein DnaC